MVVWRAATLIALWFAMIFTLWLLATLLVSVQLPHVHGCYILGQAVSGSMQDVVNRGAVVAIHLRDVADAGEMVARVAE